MPSLPAPLRISKDATGRYRSVPQPLPSTLASLKDVRGPRNVRERGLEYTGASLTTIRAQLRKLHNARSRASVKSERRFMHTLREVLA
jgi:hypothetical protein